MAGSNITELKICSRDARLVQMHMVPLEPEELVCHYETDDCWVYYPNDDLRDEEYYDEYYDDEEEEEPDCDDLHVSVGRCSGCKEKCNSNSMLCHNCLVGFKALDVRGTQAMLLPFDARKRAREEATNRVTNYLQ